LNTLVLSAGLSWREVEVLRTLRNHLLQIRTHYNVETVNGVLLRNSAVAGSIYEVAPRPDSTARQRAGHRGVAARPCRA
jgi:NAD-specific glutamate dehydrogenase